MNTKLLTYVAPLLLAFPDFVCAQFKFYESFDGYRVESKASENIADLTQAPVIWSDEAYTSIKPITTLKTLPGLESISNNSNSPTGTNSIPRILSEGSALLFTYKPGTNSWSEQRFKLNPAHLGGRKGLSELWLQYDIFIPSNYRIVDDNPSSTNYFGAGHKVLALYADAYSHPNTTLILGGVIARKNAAGATEYDGNIYQMSSLSWYKGGERIYLQMGIDEHFRRRMWIDAQRDLGTWQRRTLKIKFPSSAAAEDGEIQAWIKRSDGTIMKIIDRVQENFYGDTQNYINAGYFNGYYNAGFAQTTYIAIDNVVISEVESSIDKTAISYEPRPGKPGNIKTIIK